jgi:hypothetical protein
MHVALRACSRALPREGSKMAISNDMIEITTSSSISVNADILRIRIAKTSLNNFLQLFFPFRQINSHCSCSSLMLDFHYTSIGPLVK